MFDNLMINKDINLFEAYNRQIKKEKNDNKKIYYVIFIEIILFIVLTALSLYRIYYLKIQNLKLTERINKLIPIEQQVKEYTAIKNLFDSKKLIVDEISKQNEMLNEVITTLEDITPTEINLENMIINKDKLSFVIKSNKEENIAQFINNMQNADIFSNVVFNGISKQGNEKRTSITADIVRK
ncbi:PilN domain-containing protein [Caloramator sp. E03]|uniref:PilN domain-containing protein n=1 Tax=Caloramator sp. E03 TaxID=2576307 RepID=UPI001110BB80|nr:PilN domain-containing protein [Caloramator sp. E03]QCX32667.1 PilN domain-containing protein [Caloramator sp. E03]